MENKAQNEWSQDANDNSGNVREGKSSLDSGNQDNERRELGDWTDAEKKGNGDYGSEEGRSDAGVTGGETDISRPYDQDGEGTIEQNNHDRSEDDEWNAQHPGELPV